MHFECNVHVVPRRGGSSVAPRRVLRNPYVTQWRNATRNDAPTRAVTRAYTQWRMLRLACVVTP